MSPKVDPVETANAVPAQADVVIVGGGIIGSAAAYFLARRGVSVALCEKGRIAGEQSSRNWGYCRQQGRDPREMPLIIESLRIWRGIEREIEADVGFHQGGIVHLADTAAELAACEGWLEQARQYQIEARILSASELDGLLPGAARPFHGALFTPSDGRAEPAKAAPAIARAAARLGAVVLTDCAVRGLETAGGRVAAAVTERGAIRTSTVLCAGGAWSRRFCGNLGIALPQLRIRSSVMRTAAAPLITETAVWAPNFAFRRRQDGGYTVAHGHALIADIVPDSFRLFRSFLPALRMEWRATRLRFGRPFFEELSMPGRWRLDEVTPFERARVLDPEPVAAILDTALANLRRAFPAFEKVPIAERWAGMIDVTPDAVPVISPVDALPGFYLATGFSGHGFGLGPGAGKLAAELVSGAAPCVDPTPYRFARFADGARPIAGL